MQVLTIFLIVYAVIGFVYACYILLFAFDKWYWFPINFVFGPIVIVFHAYNVLVKGKEEYNE